MKAFVFIFAAVFAAVMAQPLESDLDRETNNLIERLVINIINRTNNRIQERGLDPVVIEKHEGEFSLPLFDIFSTSSDVSDFYLSGGSNVVINSVTFSVFRGIIALDLTWPRLATSAGSIVGETRIFGRELEVSTSGSLVIEQARLTTRFRLSYLPTLSIRELSAALTVGDVDSRLNVVLFGRDVSERVNDDLNRRLPALLDFYNDHVKDIVERIVIRIINSLW